MNKNLTVRPYTRSSPYKGLGRMLLISFVVHLVIFGLFAGDFFPRRKFEQPKAIRVNLANLPVANPQAGRPDAVKQAKKPKKKKPAKKITAKKPPQKPVVPPKPKPKPKPKPTKPKPQPKKPVVTKPAVDQEKLRQQRLEALRKQRAEEQERQQRQQKIDELKQRLAQLNAEPGNETKGPDAPVGEIDGKGTEEGVSHSRWIQEYIQQQWRLSKYQVAGRDARAKVKVIYSSKGTLLDFQFLEKSGVTQFDESLKNAILKSRELPNPLGKRVEYDINFNLDEMQE